MGNRREPRKEIKVPVRIFGTDSEGKIFSEKVLTADVSKQGVQLSGVQAQPKIDEIIGLTYGATKSHFRVKWVGKPGTAQAGHLGLLNLSPEKTFWDFPLPSPAVDTSAQNTRERRAHPRLKCANSVEVYPVGQTTPIRSRTSDLSVGGCFLEMPNPLPAGAQIKLALWIKEFKLWVKGEVITSTPGFGIGVKFTELADRDRNQLKQFLESMVRIRI